VVSTTPVAQLESLESEHATSNPATSATTTATAAPEHLDPERIIQTSPPATAARRAFSRAQRRDRGRTLGARRDFLKIDRRSTAAPRPA
jgi:hypothetical protein